MTARTEINQHNEQGQKTGPWEDYYGDGKLANTGDYLNGEKTGTWKVYLRNGVVRDTRVEYALRIAMTVFTRVGGMPEPVQAPPAVALDDVTNG